MNEMNCKQRIEEMFHKLPQKKAVAELILTSPEKVMEMSIDEISTVCGCGASTIVRLAKRLGHNGYKELIRALSKDLTITEHHEYEYIVGGEGTCFLVIHRVSQAEVAF